MINAFGNYIGFGQPQIYPLTNAVGSVDITFDGPDTIFTFFNTSGSTGQGTGSFWFEKDYQVEYLLVGGGGQGGNGGYGFYNAPISQPFSNTYAVGGAGSGGSGNTVPGQAGTAGGNTNLTNVGTVNAGNGGQGGGQGSASGNSGNQPGAAYTGWPRSFIGGFAYGNQGNGGRATCNCGNSTPGNPGSSGALIIFENTGT